MQRLPAVLATLILLAAVPATAANPDLNSDGKVDLADALLSLRVVTGTAPAAIPPQAGDVDGDGRIGLAETLSTLTLIARQHDTTTFAWGGDCAGCHSDNGLGIVAGVHGSSCTLCHTVSFGGAGTATTGAGGDGDATLAAALADFRLADCLTCHPTATYAKSWIHHDTPSATAGNCVGCHNGGNGHAGNHTTTVRPAADCAGCHAGSEGGLVNLPVDPADNKVHDACTSCHATDAGTKKVGLIDPAMSDLVIAMPDPGPGTTDGGGTCTACHGAWFPNHRNIDHATSRVTAGANCTGCHDATGGGTAPDAIAPPYTGAGEAHAPRGCATCHLANGALVAPTAVAPGIGAGGGNCETCHGAWFPNHLRPDHSALVAATANCERCHPATAGSASGMPVNPADNKVHDACAGCHDLVDGSLLAVTAPGGGTPIGRGDCNGCHGAYFASHARADHSGRVGGLAECVTCHTATAGSATTVPLSTVDDKVHDSCATCHVLADGSLRTPYGRAVAIPALGGDCAACHGFFQNHLHHDSTPPNDLRYDPVTDTSQPGAQPCAACHHDHDNANSTAVGLSTFAAILWEHDVRDGVQNGIGACQNCHAYVGDRSAPLVDVRNAIAAGLPATCASCHTDKVPAVGHGGHDATTFTWDTGCSPCHNDGGQGIVAGVHRNNCALCHSDPAGGMGTAKSGARGDGDATLAAALVDFATAACLTCHNPALFPTGAIHHDSRSAANNDCTVCHAAVDHTTTIVPALPCSRCHTGSGGAAAGAPVSPTDPMVHDACVTCHTFDGGLRGILKNFSNSRGVNGTGTLPDGNTSGGSDGGGVCTVCHTGLAAAASDFHHAISHGASYAAVGECEHCHADPRSGWAANLPGDANATGTALTGAGTLIPTQLACANCHASFAGGNLVITRYSRSNYTNLSTDWTRATAHTVPNSAGRINNWGICFSCHDSDPGDGAPLVSVWHARPDVHGGAAWALGTSRYQRSRCYGNEARYAPGRAYDGSGDNGAVSSNLGAFNLFRANYYYANGPNDKPGGSTDCSATINAYNAKPAATANFVRIAIPGVIHNGGVAGQQVPVFAMKPPNSGTPAPPADAVRVAAAVWNGTTLTVQAANSMGCSALTVRDAANPAVTYGTMIGSGTCSLAVPLAVMPAAVDVVTSNPDGIGVSGYRVESTAP
ncbi:MAG: dockerin type I domain-containing protein [Thermodesulfobacteriota bacterium]